MPISANTSGILSGRFTIPAHIAAGVKQVTFVGSGGTHAAATYAASGVVVTRIWRQIHTTVVRKYDPLAQTFTLPEARMICAVDIKFHVKGGNKPVYVQIREVETGVPNQTVLAEGRIDYSSILLANQWTRCTFPVPVHLFEDREYAIVVMTDDPNHQVAIAELGQYAQAADNAGQEGFVTSQPYQIGVLLSSSNASTWTPHQNADLTFRLLACKFTASSRTVTLGSLAATNVTDMQVRSSVYRPSPETDVTFTIRETTPAVDHEGVEGQAISLISRTNDTFSFKGTLVGDSKMSPILFPNSALLLGNTQDTANYITKAIKAAVSFAATVTFEVLKPGGSTVVAKMETQRMSGSVEVVDGGGTYLSDYVDCTLDKRTPVGDGWYEEVWKVTGLRGVGVDRYTRCQLVLSGSPAARPRVRRLRVVAK